MPRPSQLTPEERRAEAKALRGRFRESEPRAMCVHAEQVVLDEATDDRLYAVIPPGETEYIFQTRARTRAGVFLPPFDE